MTDPVTTNIEIHPWKWFAPAESKTLIIGTFPSAKRNWSYEFFYPNKANLFWRVMAHLTTTELQYFSGAAAVAERKMILEKLKVAITDMGFRIIRTNGSSLDNNLTVEEFMNIFQILDENPTIDKIILTSSTGKSSALKWFSDYIIQNKGTLDIKKGTVPRNGTLLYKGNAIHVSIVYSSSPAAAIGVPRLIELYQKEIFAG